MAEVRRYSRSARVVTEVQPSYTPPSAARAQMFDTVKDGFEAGIKFMRPAVELEQTLKGEKAANEAFENGSFEMRKPFSIRDGAFNMTGERLVTNKAMLDLDEGFRGAMSRSNGSIRQLEIELAKLKTMQGELPEIPGLQTSWQETYDRGVASSRRQTTQLAQRRAVAAQRQAASDAAANSRSEMQRLALTAGTRDELAAATAQGIETIAQYGPRGAFELNGVEYPANPNRSGMLTSRQLQSQADTLTKEAHEIFLMADFERTDNPSAWAAEFENEVLSGNSPLDVGRSLSLLNTMNGRARAAENAIRAEERRTEVALAAAADAQLNPYIVAVSNGMGEAMPLEDRTALLASLEGNPGLYTEASNQLAAADAVVAMNGMDGPGRIAHVEGLFKQFEATPGVNAAEAAVIDAVAPLLRAAKASLTRETTGISAANQMLERGQMPDDEQMDEIFNQSRGNPVTEEAYSVLENAMNIIKAGSDMSGNDREEMNNAIQGALDDLAVQDGAVGASARRRLAGAEKAQEHFKTLETMATDDNARFAVTMGVELQEFPSPDEATLPLVASVIVDRIAQVSELSAQFDNDNPVPITSSEQAAITDWMAAAGTSQRVGFVETLLNALSADQADAVIEAVGVSNPTLKAAGQVIRDNPGAGRIILSGMGAKITGDTVVNVAEGQASIRPILGFLSQGQITITDETAMAYAKGAAVADGQTEITAANLTKGYDIALGADQDGDGGLEEIRGGIGSNYGTTILPTGISGREFGRAFKALDDRTYMRLAGGPAIDGRGEIFTSRQLKQTIYSFQPDPTRPGFMVPLDEMGMPLRVRKSDGSGIALMSISAEDLVDG